MHYSCFIIWEVQAIGLQKDEQTLLLCFGKRRLSARDQKDSHDTIKWFVVTQFLSFLLSVALV